MMFLRNNAVGLALVVLAGCNGAGSPDAASPSSVSGSDAAETVVLRIEGMNERLKIM